MENLNRHLLALAVVLSFVLLAGCGEDKNSGKKTGGATPAPSAIGSPATLPPAPLPPIGKELATVPGASIKRIAPPANDDGGFAADNNKLMAHNRPLGEIITEAAQCGLLVGDLPLPGGVYDVTIPVPADQPAWNSAKPVIEQAFGLKLERSKRDEDAYVLRSPTTRPAGFKSPAPGTATSSNMTAKGYTFHNSGLGNLCHFLADDLKCLVVDETHIDGEFDFDLPGYIPNNPDAVMQSVAALGLEMKKEKRPVDCVVVSKAASAATTAPATTRPDK